MEKGVKFLNFGEKKISSNFNADIGHHQWYNG